jgi:hypothetical protein
MRLASAIEQQPAVMLVCQAVVACQRMVSTLRDGFSKAFPQLQDVNKDVSLALCLTGMAAGGVGAASGTWVDNIVDGGGSSGSGCRCRCCRCFRSSCFPHRRHPPKPASCSLPPCPPPYTHTQDLKRHLARGARMMALLALPLARASTESLTAVYARTFEKAAFGFAKVRAGEGGRAEGCRAQRGAVRFYLPAWLALSAAAARAEVQQRW